PALERRTHARGTVHELVAEAAPVAQEVAVDLVMVAVADATELAVTLAGDRVAADGAVHAYRRRRLQIPLARVVPLECLVVEDAGRADLDEVSRELVLERAVGVAAEVYVVVAAEDVEVAPTGVVAIKAHAAIALDAAVHLVVDERAEVLVAVGALGEPVATIVVPGHDRHVLQVALAALVADRTVVRVIRHQPLDDAGAELVRFPVVDRDA